MYSVRLLGGLSFEGPSGPVSGAPAQRRELALLAILAVASRRGVTRDKLVGYLWPDTDEDTARRLLSNALYVLRREMGEESVRTAGDTVRLDPEIVRSDVGAFQEALAAGNLEEAAASYAGPFLDGFYADAGPAFENWVDSERRRLGLLYAEALESLADRAEAANDHARAAGWWQRLLAHDAYNSRAVLRLMQALAAAGDRANALKAATEHERLLKDELGLEPAPEVLDLARKLREEETAPAERGPRAKAAALPEEVQLRRLFLTRRSAALGIVAALAVAAAVATGRVLLRAPVHRIGGAGIPVSQNRIAVLPFENIGGLEENQAFTDGIHDDILTHLYKIGDLKPIARTSVLRYRGTTKSVREIAEELGVATVLEGGVQRVGDRVRISAQLVDPETEQHLWAETYDSTLTAQNIFSIQTDIARRIARALRATLSSEEEAGIEARPTDNLEAYEYYIRGKADLAGWRDPDAGVRLLERAVEIDPEFAVAWAELAWAQLARYYMYIDVGLRESGLEALNRAVELAPDAFETHIVQAQYHRLIRHDIDQALEHMQAAERLRPNDAALHSRMGSTLAFAGRPDESRASYRKAAELDPLNAVYAVQVGRGYSALGNLAEAERYYDRAIALDPSSPLGYNNKFSFLVQAVGDTVRAREFAEQHPERSEAWLPRLDYLRREYERALEGYLSRPMPGELASEVTWWNPVLSVYRAMNEHERLRALADSLRSEHERLLGELIEQRAPPTQIAFVHCWLGSHYAFLGDEEVAIREVKEALAVSSDAINYPLILRLVAHVYLLVGRYDEAIDYLEATLSEPSWRIKAAYLRIDPFYDPLRDHPRFQALLER